MACHAGGQFPELTQYGRLFKLTGYTQGERTIPVAVMGLLTDSSVNNTSKSDDPGADFPKNNSLIMPTASIFFAGKITENLGAFTQITYDAYARQSESGAFHGHAQADNMDLRYADRFIDPTRDLIFGISLNNNPSVSDPWNTAPAWNQYVPVPSPGSSRFIDGMAPYPGYAAGSNLAGFSAYTYINQTWYGELGAYGTSDHLFSFMSSGLSASDRAQLKGLNPYWRLAYTRQWGAHNLMVGTSGMVSNVYDNPPDRDPAALSHFKDLGLDAQYQFLLDPHTVTVQMAYMRNHVRYSDAAANQASAFVDSNGNALPASNATDTSHVWRTKATYVYQARYGGSVSLFGLNGHANTANQTSGYDPNTLAVTSDPSAASPSVRVSGNLSGNPSTRGSTLEMFYLPIQYARLGLQYTMYAKYNGAKSNYDGFGRNASDNDSLFLYLWATY